MRPQYRTDRLTVRALTNLAEAPSDLASDTLALFSPEVQATLPEHWPPVTDATGARQWLQDRLDEAWLLEVRMSSDTTLVGFLLIHPSIVVEIGTTWHLGYLLGDAYWGQGLASELVAGLVNWCQQNGQVASLRAGVASDHPASARVLTKNGFSEVQRQDTPEDVRFFERHFHDHPDGVESP